MRSEIEKKQPIMDATAEPQDCCCTCHAPLPDDGRTRKRNRERRCKACNAAAAIKRRKEDPVRLLCHRLNGACRRLGITDPHMWAPQTVKRAMERWGNRSVLSGESKPELLCLVSYWDTNAVPLKPEHLVLVTSREAQSLARDKERTARFPAHVKQAMLLPEAGDQ